MIVALIVVVVIVIFVVSLYNRLVSLKVRAQNAWSDIDVQLKRRADLVPNLVETVKGYAAHERGTLDAVTQARTRAVAAQNAGPATRAAAEGELTSALRGLTVAVEAYPQLQASGGLSGSSGPARYHRRRGPEFPPILQRGGARLQHRHLDDSIESRRWPDGVPGARVLRGWRRRPRAAESQLLKKLRRSLLLAAVLAVGFAQLAGAQNGTIRIRDFGALLTVQPNGSLDVVEQLTIGFTGEWHGINRDISLRHNTARGRATRLDIDIGNVTDGDGNPLRVEQSKKDNGWTRSLKIYIPDAIDADRRVIIHYRVTNAIRFYFKKAGQDPFDELYWNVTGTGWDMPIDSAHARVVLPDGVIPTRTAVYTGPEGSKASNATIEPDSNEVGFSTREGLRPYEGMTIAVGWPPGPVAGRPSEVEEQLLDLVQWLPLAMPLIAFILFYRYWQKKGRDPKEEPIVVQYEPVKGASPAELGALVDNTADMQDITATLIDLGVRGFVHITELTQEQLLGLVKKTDYRIDILRQRNDWSGLKEHESSYLDALAESAPTGEDSVKVSELQNRFYKFLPRIKNAIYDCLVAAGYYRERPDQSRGKGVGFSVLGMLIVGAITGLTWNGNFTLLDPIVTLVAGGITVVILIIFAQLMPARTVAGARAREAALGFKEFLSRVEEDRYKKMITSPALFEKYLPYAMAFGVADKWANAFKDIYREPPQWYSGGTGPFNAASFSQSISTFSTAAGSSMGSSPGSSGSGGGGSSGGGSGGGGGSGF